MECQQYFIYPISGVNIQNTQTSDHPFKATNNQTYTTWYLDYVQQERAHTEDKQTDYYYYDEYVHQSISQITSHSNPLLSIPTNTRADQRIK